MFLYSSDDIFNMFLLLILLRINRFFFICTSHDLTLLEVLFFIFLRALNWSIAYYFHLNLFSCNLLDQHRHYLTRFFLSLLASNGAGQSSLYKWLRYLWFAIGSFRMFTNYWCTISPVKKSAQTSIKCSIHYLLGF